MVLIFIRKFTRRFTTSSKNNLDIDELISRMINRLIVLKGEIRKESYEKANANATAIANANAIVRSIAIPGIKSNIVTDNTKKHK
jgi:hypothetical protein